MPLSQLQSVNIDFGLWISVMILAVLMLGFLDYGKQNLNNWIIGLTILV